MGGRITPCAPQLAEKPSVNDQLGGSALWTVSTATFLDHRDVGDGDEFKTAAALIIHQRLLIFGDQTVLGSSNPHHVAAVEPQRIGLKWLAVINVQQGVFCHARIVAYSSSSVNVRQAHPSITREGSGGLFARYTGAPDVTYRLQRVASVTGSVVRPRHPAVAGRPPPASSNFTKPPRRPANPSPAPSSRDRELERGQSSQLATRSPVTRTKSPVLRVSSVAS